MARFGRRLFVGAVVLIGLAYIGFAVPMELTWYLVAGWLRFLGRVVPQLHVNLLNVMVAIVFFLAFDLGLHSFLSWLQRNRARTAPPSGADTAQLPAPWPWRWTHAVAALTVAAFIAGTAIVGMTHQAIWIFSDDEPLFRNSFSLVSQRIQSSNNLKQIGIGLRAYQGVWGVPPAAAPRDQHGRIWHGWQSRILPYVEESYLYGKIDFAKPWNDSVNTLVMRTRVPIFELRYDHFSQPPADGLAPTTYAANCHVLGGDTAISLEDVADGASQTILAGEVSGVLPAWGRPGNSRDPSLGVDGSPGAFGGSRQMGGALLVFVDGSVRFISANINPAVLRALATPNGAETIDLADVHAANDP